jgi:branched-chain amino acid transport system substrate-binding protein
MKKLIGMAMVACVGIILACFDTGLTQTPAPYVLGFTLDLTGMRADISIGPKRSAQIKIDEINGAGGVNGRHLKAIFYDGESDPVKNVKNVKRIIDVDRAVACMGFSAVDASLASLKTAEDGKTLLISGAPCIVSGRPPRKWLFSTCGDQKVASIPILIRNLLDRGAKKIAYLYIDTAFGALGNAAFKSSCEKLGVTPAIIEKYVPSVVDLSPQIAHIKASGADGLLITGNVADTVKVLKTARDHGIGYPIVCDYAITGPDFIPLAGKYGEGIVTTGQKAIVAHDLPDTDIQKKVCVELYDKYAKQFGAYNNFAGHGWDQVTLIATALRKIDPKLDPVKDKDLEKIRSDLRDSLENLKGVVGVSGIFNYSETDHLGLAEGCYPPLVVRDGKWRLYK